MKKSSEWITILLAIFLMVVGFALIANGYASESMLIAGFVLSSIGAVLVLLLAFVATVRPRRQKVKGELFWFWSFVVWIIGSGLLTGLFFLIDHFVGDVKHWRRSGSYYYLPGITWAPGASLAVTIVLAVNLISANILKPYLERQGRNVVAWTTAIVVFTPILAGIAYLLTWPKDKVLKG